MPKQLLQPQGEFPVVGLGRRLAAMFYDFLLCTALLMVTTLVYKMVQMAIIGETRMRALTEAGALDGDPLLSTVLLFMLFGFFAKFWTHGGQTLALKTWQLRLVTPQGGPIAPLRALLRYLTSWLWFIPPLLLTWLAGWHDKGSITAAVLGWMVLYAALTWVLPSRQFLHDVISGTRVIDNRKQVP